MKPYLVENSVRRFEQGIIKFSIYDEILYRQLIGYQIAKINASGMPVYEAGPDGDHDLDGLMLGLLAFQMETSEFVKPSFNGTISFSGNFGDGANRESPVTQALAGVDNHSKSEVKVGVPEPRTMYNNMSSVSMINGAKTITNIYDPESFKNDGRGRQAAAQRNSSFLKRGSSRTGRRSF